MIRFSPPSAGMALLSLLVALAASCSAPPRNAVPKELVEKARIPGMPDVRFWGDTSDPAVEAAFLKSLEAERAALGLRPWEELPDSHFLALSGGGANGAYGAGVLCGWTMRGDRPQFKVVTGISTGALIAPFAFLGPKYDHLLEEAYTTVSTRDIATRRGLLTGLASDAMADNAPLRGMVDRLVTKEIMDEIAAESRKGRILIIGTTNLDSQRPVIWSMGRIARYGTPEALQLFKYVLLASSAIPGAFPPVMITVEADGTLYEEMHSDGGVTSQVFLYPASFSFEKVDEMMHSHRERHVYVIRNAQLASTYEVVPRRTLPISVRAIDTLIRAQGVGDLYRIYLGCVRDKIDFNLASIPPEFDGVSQEPFDPVVMRKLFDLGFRRAQEGYPWADAPPGFHPPERPGSKKSF